MDYDRLRELQAKFDENPRRYFAPLANEYRKGGNPKRAIEICRAHLAQMPGHMSGQVVYGQSLFEGGEYDEARKVFEGALVLDPENLIALRSLGDLSLQSGDTGEARSWYTRLLDADPKDAAVAALIAVIDSSPSAVGEAEKTSELTVDFSFVDNPPAGAVSASSGSQAAKPEHHTTESEPAVSTSMQFGEAALASPAETSTPDRLPSQSSPAESTATESTPSESRKPEDSIPEASPSDSSTWHSSRPEPNLDPEAPENAPPSSTASWVESHRTEEAAAATGNADQERALGLEHHYPTVESVTEPAEPMGPDRDGLDWSPPAAETQERSRPLPKPSSAEPPASPSFAGTNPEPFVNETMAQLYLQQGYLQLALRVYRQLSDRRPNDQGLKDRITEIEARQAKESGGAEPEARREEPPSVESPTPEPAAPRAPSTEAPLPHEPANQPTSVESPGIDTFPVDSPPSAPSGEPDSIESPVREEPRAEPEGIAARQPSMREFFATLGRRRPAPPGKSSSNDSWSRASAAPVSVPDASASLASLDAVFAGAKVSSSDARAASTLAGAFSASARATSPPSPPSNPTPRANPRLQTQESEEDVAKFRAWLDGLTGE